MKKIYLGNIEGIEKEAVRALLAERDWELLEKALRCFCGRAMADGTYEIAEQELRPLVERYGLIVL